MNSHTLLFLFGYFLISLCALTINTTDPNGSAFGTDSKPVVHRSMPTSVRGGYKPSIEPREPKSLGEGASDLRSNVTGVGGETGIRREDTEAHLKEQTAKEAAEAAAAAAEEAAIHEAKADEYARKIEAAKKGFTDFTENFKTSDKKVEDILKKIKTVTKPEEATVLAKEADAEEKKVDEENVKMEALIKEVKEMFASAEEGLKKVNAAAELAQKKSDEAALLDKEPGTPSALLAKKKADEAKESANKTKISVDAIILLIVDYDALVKTATTSIEKVKKEKAEIYVIAKEKGADLSDGPDVPIVPVVPEKPESDTPTDALMNFVKDDKYDYRDQLLKEDRCTKEDIEKIGCKEYSNCYRDHNTPICICFPGYYSDDATKTDCKAVDSPACNNKANTCHMNANCKESSTDGIGCQCKEKFNGDGLLCSSAFSYFMNFLLVLTVVSVQLYI